MPHCRQRYQCGACLLSIFSMTTCTSFIHPLRLSPTGSSSGAPAVPSSLRISVAIRTSLHAASSGSSDSPDGNDSSGDQDQGQQQQGSLDLKQLLQTPSNLSSDPDALSLLSKPYASSLVREINENELRNVLASLERETYIEECEIDPDNCEPLTSAAEEGQHQHQQPKFGSSTDPLWKQIRVEAENLLALEPQSGPQLYSLILSQPSLIEAVATIISNEIETELIPATSLCNLFLEQLTAEDRRSITLDIMAAALRSPSVGTATNAVLFNRGLHALVCYRLGHRLWQAGRTGLAYYMQSTVSVKYSADIHPAARLGSGIYLNCGGGVVIGETVIMGDDVSILQGVTLGGTGKEAGDRHPKVGDGVILHDGATVLGNIKIGDGAVVTAKSIVTKPVPPLARVAGVPAKVTSYREITDSHLYPDENALARPVAGSGGSTSVLPNK